jgi:hypothetical protein
MMLCVPLTSSRDRAKGKTKQTETVYYLLQKVK